MFRFDLYHSIKSIIIFSCIEVEVLIAVVDTQSCSVTGREKKTPREDARKTTGEGTEGEIVKKKERGASVLVLS